MGFKKKFLNIIKKLKTSKDDNTDTNCHNSKVSKEDFAYHILCQMQNACSEKAYIDGITLNMVLEVLGITDYVPNEFSSLKNIDIQDNTFYFFVSIIKNSEDEFSYLKFKQNADDSWRFLRGTDWKTSNGGLVRYCPKNVSVDTRFDDIHSIEFYDYIDIICKYYAILTEECFSMESNLYFKVMSLSLLFFIQTYNANEDQDRIINRAKEIIVKAHDKKSSKDFTMLSLGNNSNRNEKISIIVANSFFHVYNRLENDNDRRRLFALFDKRVDLHICKISNINNQISIIKH